MVIETGSTRVDLDVNAITVAWNKKARKRDATVYVKTDRNTLAIMHDGTVQYYPKVT